MNYQKGISASTTIKYWSNGIKDTGANLEPTLRALPTIRRASFVPMPRKAKDGTTCKTFGSQSQVSFPGMDGQLMIVMVTLWPSSKSYEK